MCHDLRLVEGHRSEHERFEIEGANAAREFFDGMAEHAVHTGPIVRARA
jgi:hypothetical protein